MFRTFNGKSLSVYWAIGSISVAENPLERLRWDPQRTNRECEYARDEVATASRMCDQCRGTDGNEQKNTTKTTAAPLIDPGCSRISA